MLMYMIILDDAHVLSGSPELAGTESVSRGVFPQGWPGPSHPHHPEANDFYLCIYLPVAALVQAADYLPLIPARSQEHLIRYHLTFLPRVISTQ